MGWVVLVVAIVLLVVACDLLFGKALLAWMHGDNIDPEAHAELRRKQDLERRKREVRARVDALPDEGDK